MSLTTKILHVVPSFGFGGMEKVICSIINHTAEVYDHEILSLDSSDEALKWIKPKNVGFVDFVKPKRNFDYFMALYRTLKKVSPGLLMTYNWGATDAIWLAKIVGIKNVIHNEHGFTIDESNSTKFKRDVMRFIAYSLSCKIIVVSQKLEHTMKRRFFIKEGKVSCIYNGINTDFYSVDKNDREKTREKLGLKYEDFVIGFSGRLDPVKNFGLMLEIFERCNRRDKSFKLLIIGDGSERKNIEKACRDKNIEESVMLVGEKENVISYLRVLDVFLLTSFTEQMPMSILEAMSLEIPVVAKKSGEIPHIIDNGKDGFTLGSNDPATEFVLSLFALKDSEKRKAIGKAARDKVTNKFHEKKMIQKYRDIVEIIL
jgi:glycosyltransferase involved in cell wall biosynthesis